MTSAVLANTACSSPSSAPIIKLLRPIAVNTAMYMSAKRTARSRCRASKVKAESRTHEKRWSQLRAPRSVSGSEVVAAAVMAPGRGVEQ